MYISFEINIQISNFVFKYPNIRILSKYPNIRILSKYPNIRRLSKYPNIRILSKYSSIRFNPTVIIVVIIVYKHVGLYTVTERGVGTDTQ